MKYQFCIGYNHKDTLLPVIGREQGRAFVRDLAARHFGGSTVIDSDGSYIMQNGKGLVCENGCVCWVYGDFTIEEVKAFCEEVKETLHQESVAVDIMPINTMFY